MVQVRTVARSDGAKVTSPVAAAPVPNLTMVDGQADQLQVALSPLGASAAGTLSVTVDRDAFASALLDGAPAGATPLTSTSPSAILAPVLAPPPFGFAALGGAVLQAKAPDGTGSISLDALAYEDAFGGAYDLLGYVEAGTNLQVTGSNGQGGNLILGVTRSGSQADLFSAPVTPGLGPIRDLQVNGVDALNAVSGATTTPELSWTAPALGTPDEYLVSLYESSTGMVLEAYTPSTTFPVPPGILHAGKTCYATVIAMQSPGQDPQAPFAISAMPYQESLYSGVQFTP